MSQNQSVKAESLREERERLREERSVVIERRARETFLKTACGLGGGESAADEIREKSAAIGHTTKG